MCAVLIGGPRRRYAATTAVAAALALTGCDAGSGGFGDGVGDPGASARTVTVSAAYLQAHADDGPQRLDRLHDALDRLRAETASGWTGRQDDVTGYLADLSGGRWFPATPDGATRAPAVATAFMDAYGPELFGVGADSLSVAGPAETLDTGTALLRVTQRVGAVPVLDGALVMTIGAADTDPRVNAVRGRVYPDLDVATTPTVTRSKVRRIATRLSGGGSVQRGPELYVLPTGPGVLAWEVPVMGIVDGGASSGVAGSLYYISATTGRLVSQRPMSAELAPLTPGLEAVSTGPALRVRPFRLRPLAAAGKSVEVHGTGPTGEALTAHGIRTGQGVLLVDTTVPGYDPQTGRGGIDVYDMGGSQDDSLLPGRPYVAPGPEVRDPDAIAALAYSRMVHDYYLDVQGRQSWDGQGHTMTSSVNYGDDSLCNAFFGMEIAQMLYGPPCRGPGGLGKLVTLDVTGHEITHGVTGSSAGLIYFGQAGALNESFSDYFGNVIGDRHLGTDSSVLSEDLCSQVTQPQRLCKPMPDGTLALRNLLNGTTFADYLRVLAPSVRLQMIAGYDNDNGGVHINSSIWNNALWSIRTQLATMDGTAAVDSARVAVLDRAVYLALTTGLTPQSGFLDARNAVLASLTDLQAGAEVLRVATQTFDAAGICSGCAEAVPSPGLAIDAEPGRQLSPAVNGDRVTWVDVDDAGIYGTATSARYDGTGRDAGGQASALAVAFAGDALVTIDASTDQVIRYDASGATVLANVPAVDAAARGLAGSESGAAWFNFNRGVLEHVDPAGTLTSAPVNGIQGEIYALGAGGGTVVIGTDQGTVYRWTPGGAVEQLGQVDGAVLSAAIHGDRALVISGRGEAVLFEGTSQRRLSDGAVPFGAAVSADHAVWPEQVGTLDGALAAAYADTDLAIDTDLFGYSFGTGHIYDLLPLEGQQGYPALSGNRLVWQDSVYGGDDVVTATLPDGL